MEGQFPKNSTDNKFLYASEASRFYYSSLVGLYSELGRNASTSLTPLLYDIFADNSKTNTGTTTAILLDADTRDATESLVNAGQIIDEFDDASVDSTLWSETTSGNGAITEADDKITITSRDGGGDGAATLTLDGASAPNLNGEVSLSLDYSATAATSGTIVLEMRLTDGSTEVVLKSFTNGDSGSLIVKISASGNEVEIYKNDFDQTETPTDTIDISALGDGATWNLILESDTTGQGGGTASTLVVYFVRRFASTTQTYYSSTQTLSETANRVIFLSDSTGDNGSVVYSVSLDGGSNYTVVSDKGYYEISNGGTSLIVKIEITSDNVGSPEVSYYGVYYFA